MKMVSDIDFSGVVVTTSSKITEFTLRFKVNENTRDIKFSEKVIGIDPET